MPNDIASPATPRAIRMPRGFALKVRVIWTLVRREILLSFRISRSGYFLALIEPIFQYSMMYAIFSSIGRHPGYGTSIGLFLATGIVPYFTFMHLSSRVMRGVRSYHSFARIPTVAPLDVAISRGILEFLTLIIFGAIVLTLLAYQGIPAVPRNPYLLAQAMLLIGATAFGVGLINGVLSHMFKFYALVYSIIARSALFFSAVFYVPATLPAQARYLLSFNPLLHGVEWYRTGIYQSYPAIGLDHNYLIAWAIGTIALGVVLLRVAEKWLTR